MEAVLIASKWGVPRTPTSLVPRPRLGKQLDAVWDKPITLISAPAGFGKTTLVAAWSTAQSHPVAWLALDAGDNDPARFFQYLIASLQTLDPLLGKAASCLAPTAPQAAIASLLNDLNSDIGEAALVLDDFHLLENPEILEAVTLLIEHAPPTFRIVLTTRADPPLPTARWRARNQLLELRVGDLRFTGTEATAFLNTAMGLDLAPDLVTKLETRTEGWIAGLQLAALSLQGRGDTVDFIESFAGSHRYVIGYLLEEVLNREPQAVQDFLLETAILERMCDALCDAVTGRADGGGTLAYLDRQNLFVIPLDEQGTWYRYHRLFADVLQNRLAHQKGHDISILHRRAARWFAQNKLYPEAIQHALDVRDFEDAAQWIETVAVQLLASGGGQIATVTNWLNALPLEMKQTRPRLLLTEAWSLMGRAPASAVEMPLQQAAALVAKQSPGESRPARGEVAALRTLLYGFMYEDLRALDFAHEALDLLPPDSFYARALVQQALGYIQLVAGDLIAVEQALYPALEIARSDPNLYLAEITVLATLGLARGERGKLREAIQFHEQARELVEREGRPLPLQSSALVYFDLALYFYEQNDLAGAERYFELAHTLNETLRDPRLAAHVLMGRTQLAAAQGDLRQAMRWLDEAIALRDHISASVSRATLDALVIAMRLEDGQCEAAQAWLTAHPLPKTAAAISVPVFLDRHSRARLALARGEWDRGFAIASETERKAQEAGHGRQVLTAQILQAIALRAQNETADALRALERALILAHPEGYVRPFVDEGKPVRELLSEYIKRTSHETLRAYAGRLLDAYAPANRPPVAPAETLVEPLSDREIEVLEWIARGASNREIAGTLIISPNTVKKHTINLFGKLGVNSRTQALVRAREIGVLQ